MMTARDRLNIGILISGRGSNMESILHACQDETYPCRVVIVISNRADAPGLEKARSAGIPAFAIPHKDFTTAADFEQTIHNHLIKHDVELVCLAGFMRILGPGFIQNWTDRIINIHPSLLPDYPGLKPQARALADKRTESGCSVHLVTGDLDAGPILGQRRVPVFENDTEDLLTARILAQEHLLYPDVLRQLAEKRLKETRHRE